MASIREVAKIAGVSPATVSRVMNGTANVDEEKKQRVLDAIHQDRLRGRANAVNCRVSSFPERGKKGK